MSGFLGHARNFFRTGGRPSVEIPPGMVEAWVATGPEGVVTVPGTAPLKLVPGLAVPPAEAKALVNRAHLVPADAAVASLLVSTFARLFRVAGEGLAYHLGCRFTSMVVLGEVEPHLAYGPNGRDVARLLDWIGALNTEQLALLGMLRAFDRFGQLRHPVEVSPDKDFEDLVKSLASTGDPRKSYEIEQARCAAALISYEIVKLHERSGGAALGDALFPALHAVDEIVADVVRHGLPPHQVPSEDRSLYELYGRLPTVLGVQLPQRTAHSAQLQAGRPPTLTAR